MVGLLSRAFTTPMKRCLRMIRASKCCNPTTATKISADTRFTYDSLLKKNVPPFSAKLENASYAHCDCNLFPVAKGGDGNAPGEIGKV